MRDAEEIPRLYSANPDEHAKRHANGIYDRFLCPECEDKFNVWDSYAIETLIQNLPAVPQIGRFKSIWPLDYHRLKMFFLSMLWRGSASQHPFYKHLELGPHCDSLREMILSNSPGSAEDYSVFVDEFDSEESRVVAGPTPRTDRSGLTFYRFIVPRMVMWIKVDSRPTPTELKLLQLTPDVPFRVLCRKWHGSQEHMEALDLVRSRERL